VAVLSSKSDF